MDVLTQHEYHNLHAYVSQKKFRCLSPKSILCSLQNGYCFYCGDWFGYSQLTIDHFIPRAHQGGHELANKVLACERCNSQKGNRLPTADELSRHALMLQALRDELKRYF